MRLRSSPRVRRALLRAGAPIAAGVLALGLAGPALASTIGQSGPPDTTFYWPAGEEDVQTDAVAPGDGVVTSFQTVSSPCHAGILRGVYDFQVLRPLGANQFLVVGDTGNLTDPCDSLPHAFSVHIPARQGDVLGVYVVSNWIGALDGNNGPQVKYDTQPEPSVGQVVTASSTPFAVSIDESATFVQAQSIAFTSTPSNPVYGASYPITATGGGSGNPVTFASGTPAVCTVSGSTAAFVGVGLCTIKADQAGTAGAFSPAPEVSQTFSVSKAMTTLVATPEGTFVRSVSATLTRSFDHAPIDGQTVTFVVNHVKVCAAHTNAQGIATCHLIGVSIAGSYSAEFAGSNNYVASTGSARF